MYREINAVEYSKELLSQLQKGAFLTVKNSDTVNTMTIAWGSMGFIWNKPIFTALVRVSRFTSELIENSSDFTVSFPINNALTKELGICGSKSGRDVDKILEANLTLKPGDEVDSPVIENCGLFIECKIVYKHDMSEAKLDEEIKNKAYAKGDYHVMYYGEIIKAYVKD